ncbi:MAG: hypothetical protein EXQ56_06705 [Acidobacteria bacterium]|nr:hypothetical protein [Acidobacteriota bacterium]
MADQATQNFKNHARFVPAFHMVLFPILFINFIWSIVQLVRSFSFGTVMGVLLAIGFIILFFCARVFALTAQDRVIRLEMRLRMKEVLPADLRARMMEFTPGQLIALRFASDEELPELARRVLTERIEDRKVIKQMIKTWVPDHLRV